ncbi:ribosomal RNA small subunit methyltransferase H [Ruminococcus sp. CAG:353]|nr:16S rRNA (cytosine(1402)-N(4))-methyltransferase RsmH [Oscillospiraceae bacterium]CDE82304.1 ribosomal RNA small subunit methyltransferase H [Ruminococcus sp. CAG:353]
MEFAHIPVLLEQCLDGLDIKPDGIYFDGTCGGAGHSREIAKRLTTGRLIGIDRDPDAVAVASERLGGLPAQVVRGNYSEIKQIADDLGICGADGILLDLGVSSYQLDNAERGFSYHNDAPLDMRMSKEGTSARDIVNEYSKEQLTKILYEYGEEKFAPRIAETIIKRRSEKPVETTTELADIVRDSIPAKFRRDKNPCKKTFQAIRIAVNCEFDHLDRALDEGFELLKPGGRFCIITFHSLEDRIVKQRFAGWCKGCTCPPDFPVCVCGNKPKGKLVCRKPLEASEEELEANPRSRSARLRIIEKL